MTEPQHGESRGSAIGDVMSSDRSSSSVPAHMDAFVDLRSDTVTRPTSLMRRAMAEAEVGDDGYGEDPTVQALQDEAAAQLGMEAAMYVPSGTMANQIAVRLLTSPGSMIVAGRRQHLVRNERGATIWNAAVQIQSVDDVSGVAPADVQAAVREAEFFGLRPMMVCLEDTHMAAGGLPLTLSTLDEIADLGLPVHVDGARVYNAAAARGEPVAEVGRRATTISCCLSKGLSAPVGSLLAGPSDLIYDALDHRRRLGGSMRQAGVIAAAGLVALRTMTGRLSEDHRRARLLAAAVAERWPHSGMDPTAVTTNVVLWDHPAPEPLLGHLLERGVRARVVAPGRMRLMTHHEIDDCAVGKAVDAILSAPC